MLKLPEPSALALIEPLVVSAVTVAPLIDPATKYCHAA
jgi:hypothetical protein